MKKRITALTAVLAGCILASAPIAAANSVMSSPSAGTAQTIHLDRHYGQTKYEMAKAIAEQFHKTNGAKTKNVILATGNGFADALSACVLAHEKEAPILFVDSSPDDSQDAFAYLRQNFDSSGTIYIVGGVGIIGSEFETALSSYGFTNVVRLAGFDQYQTSSVLARSLNQENLSTVVISSGEQFPDALGISSFAANCGWPILLTDHAELSTEMKDYLREKRPSKVYITGGSGVISEDVRLEIAGILPQADIQRLAGDSRFDTNMIIAETFTSVPETIYIATGYDFAYALAGSVLAAKNGDPLLFVDPATATLPKSAAHYLAGLHANRVSPKLVALGSIDVVSDEVMGNARELLLGVVKETGVYAIQDLTAAVSLYEPYALPDTIPALLYNSVTSNVNVEWNSSLVNTRVLGTTVFEGVVEGYRKPVKLTLAVNPRSVTPSVFVPDFSFIPHVWSGTYGTSGLGNPLTYYAVGNGANHLTLNFAIHGFEPNFANDGMELVFMAGEVLRALSDHYELVKENNWTVFVIPTSNPDGLLSGTSNNGPGRCTVKRYGNSRDEIVDGGIDLNRSFEYLQMENGVPVKAFHPITDRRATYTGPEANWSVESEALKKFIDMNFSASGVNVFIDNHGWTEQIIIGQGGASNKLYQLFNDQFAYNEAATFATDAGRGYVVRYAEDLAGMDACLFEFPGDVEKPGDIVTKGYNLKYINAIKNMLSGYPN